VRRPAESARKQIVQGSPRSVSRFYTFAVVRDLRALLCGAKTREKNMKILMVLTSHHQLGNTGRKTGFWLEEFAPLDIGASTCAAADRQTVVRR